MTSGSRSRNGCSSCRRRKRRCDEHKPVCLSCARTGAECIYPAPLSAATPARFIITVSHGHYFLPRPDEACKTSFLHMSPDELINCQEKFRCDDCPAQRLSDESCRNGQASMDAGSTIPPTLALCQFTPNSETSGPREVVLIQYYAEVISSSRVYIQTARNPFSSSVVPRVLHRQGPLRYMVMALSTAEWSQRSDPHGPSYRSISICYKIRALKELQERFSIAEHAEENLLTCLLMSSLEIAEGSQPAWLQHLQGAFALLDNFAAWINPEISTFASTYFRFRYIMMETTGPKVLNDFWQGSSSAPLMVIDATLHHRVEELIGCPIEVVDIINEITTFSITMRSGRGILPHAQGQLFERRLKHLALNTHRLGVNEYLLLSTDAFQTAAQIYLRLVCYKMPITDSSILQLHETLCMRLQGVIVEGGPRRSFPMWPLFIAGCTAANDAQRKIIIELFGVVNSQWPISNISAVGTAVRTIWHSRDLEFATTSGHQQDWQDVINKFGWKLALS
ncbi:fungal-specific transcription factor domain-containing protein [Aspergillus heterothallicus]